MKSSLPVRSTARKLTLLTLVLSPRNRGGNSSNGLPLVRIFGDADRGDVGLEQIDGLDCSAHGRRSFAASIF